MSGDDTADLDAVAFATVVACANTVTLITEEEVADVIDDHRSNPRAKWTKYDHGQAYCSIMHDYLGPTPAHSFEKMFHMTLSRFWAIFANIRASGNKFFFGDSLTGARPEARLLLPIKSLALGDPTHAFIDYFQMSRTMAAECCRQFDKAMIRVYKAEYLRQPTSDDMKAIVALHHAKHGVKGMFGSLDCMHHPWKNCPKAWQGSHKNGKEKKMPTQILEGLCDYNLWFWHAFYGLPGAYNDLNVNRVSNLMRQWTDGSFEEVEK